MAEFQRLTPSTVLVVEDDVLMQLELASWLGELGLTVLTADNADEALPLLDAHPEIEHLLTDIQMPGSMDGIRLAYCVAERRPRPNIIVVSGKCGVDASHLPPGSAFVPKPFERRQIWSALANI